MKSVMFVLFVILGFSLAFGVGQIDIAYSPYTISNSGSYIVVKDLNTNVSLNGITIQANNVFLDLNGHSLTGTGISLASSTSYGIYGDTPYNNITIINGTVRYGLRGGINLGGNLIQISRIKACNNGSDGIHVGDFCKISDCIIDTNRNYGINIGNNGLVENCIVSNNTSNGIYSGNNCTFKNNNVLSNGTTLSMTGIVTGYGAILTGNNCNYNGSMGMTTLYGATITGNNCNYNGYIGMNTSYGATITGNNCQYNGNHGINVTDKSILVGNTSNNNGSCGIYANDFCMIKDNIISGNYTVGIQANRYNNIVENTVSDQARPYDAGIYVTGAHNRIDSNHICGNYYGVYFIFSNNWSGRNTLSTNTINFAGLFPTDLGTGFSNFTTY